MKIQIGLPCEPQWLCDGIAFGVGILLLLVLIGLIQVILKEQKKGK